MTGKFLPAATGNGSSAYRSAQCDAFDRDGHRCVLASGHDRQGGPTQHRSDFDDEVRIWSVRMPPIAGVSRYR